MSSPPDRPTAPEAADSVLPVFLTLESAFLLAWNNPAPLWRAVRLPGAIYIVAGVGTDVAFYVSGSAFVWTIIPALLRFTPLLWIAYPWFRVAVLGPHAFEWPYSNAKRRQTDNRYLGHGVILGLLYQLGMVPIALVVGVLFVLVGTLFGLHELDIDELTDLLDLGNEKFDFFIFSSLSLPTLIVIIFFLNLLFARFLLLFPALALGARAGIAKSFRQCQGCAIRFASILTIMISANLVLVFLAEYYGLWAYDISRNAPMLVRYWIGSELLTLITSSFDILIVIWGSGAIALVYKHQVLSEDSPPSDLAG